MARNVHVMKKVSIKFYSFWRKLNVSARKKKILTTASKKIKSQLPQQLRQIEQFCKNFTMNCFYGEQFCRLSGEKIWIFHRFCKNTPSETHHSRRFQRSERRPIERTHQFTWGNSIWLLPYLLSFGGQKGCPTPWVSFSFQRSYCSTIVVRSSTGTTYLVSDRRAPWIHGSDSRHPHNLLFLSPYPIFVSVTTRVPWIHGAGRREFTAGARRTDTSEYL